MPQQEHFSYLYISWPTGTPIAESKQAYTAKLRLFSVLARYWWNELPTNVRIAESLSIFCKRPPPPRV